ncbi:MAG: mandelate racemase/muconate lactonizing enzyme family protein [Candidatus Rokubacteria bacterium]|nr:mandelate racemase/muconate lactonizing enzyme family protein [Candidatus Rokubacteria bacterium]
MKIRDVEVVVLAAPGDYGLTAGGESHGPKYTCVFIVHTDEGLTGIAQVETQPHVAAAIVGAPGEASGMFSGLRALAIGQDPLQVEPLWDRLFVGSFYFGRRGAALQAISGIDIACWDILGKATGLPVAVLLGGRRREAVRAYASTLFRTSPAAVREAARAYVEGGFTAVKFGWGVFGEDRRRDVALVEAAREGLGDDPELMVDAGWRRRRTAKEAIGLVRSLEAFRPYWVEEPCFPEDYDSYRRLSEAVTTKIAAGEAESTIWGFRQLAEQGGVDVLQPDMSRCGGLTVARRVAHYAQERNIMVCAHAWGSDILTAATLHFAAFVPGETFLEFNTSRDPLSRELVTRPFELIGGAVGVPTAPGLGVELNTEALSRLRVA